MLIEHIFNPALGKIRHIKMWCGESTVHLYLYLVNTWCGWCGSLEMSSSILWLMWLCWDRHYG